MFLLTTCRLSEPAHLIKYDLVDRVEGKCVVLGIVRLLVYDRLMLDKPLEYEKDFRFLHAFRCRFALFCKRIFTESGRRIQEFGEGACHTGELRQNSDD